jgi:hypothetical protein
MRSINNLVSAPKKDEISVIVIKNGEARQLYDLPSELKTKLLEYYDREPVVGISKDCYIRMEELLERQLIRYRNSLTETEDDDEIFAHAVAFAQTFGIYSNESPLLFELLCWIDRVLSEAEDINSRRINCKAALEYLNRQRKTTIYSYRDVAKEFRYLKRVIFGNTSEIKVGFIKFLKFYYALNKSDLVLA